jgi:hypothetical protein
MIVARERINYATNCPLIQPIKPRVVSSGCCAPAGETASVQITANCKAVRFRLWQLTSNETKMSCGEREYASQQDEGKKS